MLSAVRFLLALILLAAFGAIAWHSVGEIHYLKGFFPRQFSVEEAFYAAWIEVAKLVIIALPFGLGMLLLAFWRPPKD